MIHEILPVGMLQCNCSIFGDEQTHNAIVIDHPGNGSPPIHLTAEVQQHIGRNQVRAVAMTSTDGVVRAPHFRVRRGQGPAVGREGEGRHVLVMADGRVE